MKNFLNSTACMLVCVSLAVPTTVTAQQETLELCTNKKKNRDYPCMTEFDVVAENQKQFKRIKKAAENGNLEALRAELESEAIAEAAADELQAEPKKKKKKPSDLAILGQAMNQRADQEDSGASNVANIEAKEAREAEERARAKQEAQAKAQAQAEADAKALAQKQAEEEAARAAALKELTKKERKALRKAERKAERAAAAAAAAGDAPAEDVQVITEEVTEENSRSSDEEFETSASGKPNKNKKKKSNKDDDGLSNFEKALLLGLGAVVVGKVLDNGDEVVSKSGDRVVVERDGELRVLKNDDTLLRQPGSNVRTETFSDGSTRNTVSRTDGSQIVTIQAPDGRVLSRTRITPEGEAIVIFDDTQPEPEISVSNLPPIQFDGDGTGNAEEDALTRALQAELGGQQANQGYSLRQVRDISQVRKLAPEIELTNIRFQSGSAAIRPEQARSLAKIGSTIVDIVQADPRSVVLIEGHTDAVGGAAYNLALSDRRAESVALALTEYFNVPPENLIVQGYGEASLKIPTLTAEPANRRAVVRNITPLLR